MHAENYLDKVEALLDREREALLTGQFETVQALAIEKDKLRAHSDLPTSPPPAQVKRLKDKSDRNQQLFAAALKGVRSVALRLQSFRKNGSALNTYGRDGARQNTDSSRQTTFQKRA